MAGNIPDIGVRLSAKGIEEVIAGFKRVEAESRKAGQGAASGFSPLTAQLESLGTLLPAISAGVAVSKLIELGLSAREAAENIGKLQEKVGGSLADLSALALAAHDNEVQFDDLSAGMIKLTKAQNEALGGSAKQKKAFADLGIGVKDLQSLQPADLFAKAAQRLGDMDAGTKKTASSLILFGKAGAGLIPLLDSIGEAGGLDKAREKAKLLGLSLTDDVVGDAQAAQDALHDLEDVAEGLATRFNAGFMGQAAQGIELFADEVEGHGVDAVETFGEKFGQVFKGVVANLILVKTVAVAVFQEMRDVYAIVFSSEIDAVKTLTEYASKIGGLVSPYLQTLRGMSGEVSHSIHIDEGSVVGDLLTKSKARLDGIVDKYNELQGKYEAAPERKKRRKTGGGGADGDGTSDEEKKKAQEEGLKLAKARSEYLQSLQDNQLAILRAGNVLAEEEDKRRYDAGLLSLDAYYDRRRDRIAAEYAAEQAILEQKRQAALGVTTSAAADALETSLKGKAANNTATPFEYKQLQEVAKVETAIIEAKDTAAGKAAQNDLDRSNARHSLSLQELSDLKALQAASGDRFGAEETGLQEEIQKFQELLEKKKQFTAEEIAAKVASFQTRGQATIDFGRSSQNYDRQMEDLQQQIAVQQGRASNGSITQFQADSQILSLERERLPVLQSLADQITRFAEASGNDELIAKAKATQGSVTQLGVTLKDVTTAQTALFNALGTQGVGDVTDFFSSIIDGSKSAGDALKDLGSAFEGIVAKMISQLLVYYAVELLVGWISGTDSKNYANIASQSPFSFSLGSLGSHAAGGWTGGGAPDKIAGIVHGQEFVVKAGPAAQFRPLLEALNAGGRAMPVASPSYSAAGAAGDSGSAAGGGVSLPAQVNIHNYTGQQVQTQQSTGAGGQSILDIVVGKAVQKVNESIASGGTTARALEGTYGLARAGVRRG